MKILFGILLGLTFISFGLAYAFLQPEHTTIILSDGLNMNDSVEVVLNGNS